MIRKQKSGKLFPFFFMFKHGFPWSKKEKKITFTFPDIVSIHRAIFLSSFV